MAGVGTHVPLVPLEGIYQYAASRRKSDSDSDHKSNKGSRNHSPLNVSEDSAAISLLSDSSHEKNNPLSSFFANTRSFFRPAARKLPEGWRFGVTVGAMLSTLALLINATVAGFTYSWMKRNGYEDSGIAPIFTGACVTASRYSTGVHLAINALSSLLLGASNYCMQCLCAPTRKDLNKAHKNGIWLDVGVQSLTNLRFISLKKLMFWVCLALSSIPLHLVYNSTFFTSTTSNYYEVYIASPAFVNGSAFLDTFDTYSPITVQLADGSLMTRSLSLGGITDPGSIQELSMQGTDGPFERLSPRACIEAYANPILAERRNLIIVTEKGWHCDNSDAEAIADPDSPTDGIRICDSSSLYRVFPVTNAPIAESGHTDWFTWICDGIEYNESTDNCGSHYKEKLGNTSAWTVEGYSVDHCLSEVLENQCSLHVAVNLLLVVIGFNAIKVIILVLVVATVRDQPLITVGDAIASFVRDPDESTRGTCLTTRHDMDKKRSSKGRTQLDLNNGTQARMYEVVSLRRWKAASTGRWVILSILIFLAITTILGLLAFAITTLNHMYNRGDAKSIAELGLGKLTSYTLIMGWAIPSTGDAAIVATVLIVNLPQALLSFLYLLLNGVFTCMALAVEWNRYGLRRRALRVSRPTGKQRCTYFLQIPYRMGIPLIVASMLLHWLISQSIFVAKIAVADQQGRKQTDPSTSPTTAAYSPLGMILTTAVATCVAVSAAVFGSRRLKPGIPMASSCSMAIAAACHPPDGTSEHAALMWGVVPQMSVSMRGEGVFHCTFSDREVEKPMTGHYYA